MPTYKVGMKMSFKHILNFCFSVSGFFNVGVVFSMDRLCSLPFTFIIRTLGQTLGVYLFNYHLYTSFKIQKYGKIFNLKKSQRFTYPNSCFPTISKTDCNLGHCHSSPYKLSNVCHPPL